MKKNNFLTKFRGNNEVPVRRSEWEPFHGFRNEMNQLFDDFFGDFPLTPSWQAPVHKGDLFSPGVDLSETDDDVIVTAELPGMDKGDVTVELQDNTLVISGEKKEEHEDKNRNWHFTEQSYGSFRREIPLPVAVKDDKAKATFKKGILKVTVPKEEEAKAKKKTIDIATD